MCIRDSGYALVQRNRKGELSLIQCGSRSLTPTQQCYATIELECLAIVWAIQKCDYYLRGLPHFDIWTDHRPLVGIFDKALAALENARLMRMREKIIPYTFKITWVAGKTHFIADALSRYPVFGPAEDNFNVDTAIKCLRSLTAEPDSLKSIYNKQNEAYNCLLYTSPSPRDRTRSRMPSSA